MNLTPEGKKRLEKMKKTLAAGLPLAGLLAATVAVADAAENQEGRRPRGNFVIYPAEERPVPGKVSYHVVEEALTPEPPENPEPPADTPSELATEEQP